MAQHAADPRPSLTTVLWFALSWKSTYTIPLARQHLASSGFGPTEGLDLQRHTIVAGFQPKNPDQWDQHEECVSMKIKPAVNQSYILSNEIKLNATEVLLTFFFFFFAKMISIKSGTKVMSCFQSHEHNNEPKCQGSMSKHKP